MRLMPPSPDFTLYETGFEGDDLLQRRKAGAQLSELLEKVEDPVVVAVDGPWGCGKSHFLKRWVGAHTKENGGKATTVYIDSFANDFLDDPLIALTGAIGDRLPQESPAGLWEMAKHFAVKLARPTLRVGAAAITAGATEYAGAVLGAGLDAVNKETQDATREFWRREEGRTAAIEGFRSILLQITKTGPIIVVIDELDRCRPDYALATLETIKHFFSVDRVHFVLGVNLEALEHIVRIRYGGGVEAAEYLKRFISLTMQLPGSVEEELASIRYFYHCADKMGISNRLAQRFGAHIELSCQPTGMSLRDVEKLLINIVLLPRRVELESFKDGYVDTIVSLALIKVMNPSLFGIIRSGDDYMSHLHSFYGIRREMLDPDSHTYNHTAYIVNGLWTFLKIGPKADERIVASFSNAFDRFPIRDPGRIVSSIIEEFLTLFAVPE